MTRANSRGVAVPRPTQDVFGRVFPKTPRYKARGVKTLQDHNDPIPKRGGGGDNDMIVEREESKINMAKIIVIQIRKTNSCVGV